VRRCFILTRCLSVTLILQHSQSILDLVRRCLADEERSDALMRLSYGLIGDLADSFPAGQLKQLLLQNWIASELRSRYRMPDETKKTMRWAHEVCIS
jgi:importin subunit beta-1